MARARLVVSTIHGRPSVGAHPPACRTHSRGRTQASAAIRVHGPEGRSWTPPALSLRVGSRHLGPADETVAWDDDQAPAGARLAPTALLYPWKAAVAPPLSPSMQSSSVSEPVRAVELAARPISCLI